MGMYSVKYSAYDRQKAVGYIAYMMVGSYFYKAEPNSTIGVWRLHYAEMDSAGKYELEEQADMMMESFGTDFLKKIGRLMCCVKFRDLGESLELVFTTCGFEEVVCTITKKGRLDIRAVPCT